jgi:hypothetical protein
VPPRPPGRRWPGCSPAAPISRRASIRRPATDDIFFLAGGIAFNVLDRGDPLPASAGRRFGFVLQATVEDPQQTAVEYVVGILPASAAVINFTQEIVDEVVGGRARFGILGLLLFVWVSTRMIGSLRSALRYVFDLQEERGVVEGKIFDTQMVSSRGRSSWPTPASPSRSRPCRPTASRCSGCPRARSCGRSRRSTRRCSPSPSSS